MALQYVFLLEILLNYYMYFPQSLQKNNVSKPAPHLEKSPKRDLSSQ